MPLQFDISLKDLNTFGVEANASFFLELNQVSDLDSVADLKGIPRLILGGGSNILFTQDFEGLVICNRLKGKKIVDEVGQNLIIEAGAGENWHELVSWCMEQDLGGLENLALIPGTVGAAPIQNIGAYGKELKDNFHALEAIDLDTGQTRFFDKTACEFAYRYSIFKQPEMQNRYLITKVQFNLKKPPHILNTSYAALSDYLNQNGIHHPSIQDVYHAIIQIRSSKLPNPSEIGNAGSFFKNPVVSHAIFDHLKHQYPNIPSYPEGNTHKKIPAAWLIEQCGWKGHRIGDAGVYPLHALVLVNYGNATGKEIMELAQLIRESVVRRFGIQLEPEVTLDGGR